MRYLLDQPEFLLAMLVAVAAGALLMLGTLMAFDAFEARRNGQAKPTAPRATPANRWGTHGHSTRTELRSAPR